MRHSPRRRLLLTFQADLRTNRHIYGSLSQRVTDIRVLLDNLDSFMLSVNEV
jgi:hypothetical protein